MASETISVVNKVTHGSHIYAYEDTITTSGVVTKGREGAEVLAAAKTGTLSTRTDDDTGELTMSASHGITTGARLDVFWTGGSRYGMVVGIVAVNAVPIDGGAGDVLPSAATAITAQVPTEETFDLATGNNAQWILGKGSKRGLIVLANASTDHLGFEVDTDGAYHWFTGNGITNPIAGDALTRVFFSNGDSTTTNSMRVEVGTD